MDVSSAASLALEAAKVAANPSGYLIAQIVELTSKKVAKSDKSPTEVSSLRVEAERQELEMRIAEAQARVAQEVAIAKRIEAAEEVEHEEFYEYVSSGKAGLKVGVDSAAVDAGAGIKRVSKRVYRFKGTATKGGDGA